MGKYDREQGFTLIEVMIALTLLSVGILAAASMQISALGGNSLADRITRSAAAGADTIELLFALDYTTDPLLNNTAPAIDFDTLTDEEVTAAVAAALDDRDTAAPTDAQKAASQRLTEIYDNLPYGADLYWNVVEDYPFTDCKMVRVTISRRDYGLVARTIPFDVVIMK